MMSYEKLDVYQCTIEFLGIAVKIIEKGPNLTVVGFLITVGVVQWNVGQF